MFIAEFGYFGNHLWLPKGDTKIANHSSQKLTKLATLSCLKLPILAIYGNQYWQLMVMNL